MSQVNSTGPSNMIQESALNGILPVENQDVSNFFQICRIYPKILRFYQLEW